MMKTASLLALTAFGPLVCAPARAADKPQDARCYEMRIYYAAPGKLDDLHARFRNHTTRIFEKHGIVNVAYWVPLAENPDNKLIYLLAYPDRAAREASWKGFFADPDWQKAQKESEAGGKLVAKVESRFLTATDYSPEIKPAAAEPRVFEMRTYTAAPGNLDRLNKRFRDHTVALFAKYGMVNFGYWTPAKGEKGADDTLLYVLAHKSKDAAAASFKSFGGDPEWQAARKASELEAGGSLTAKDGFKSEFMKATDYSATK